MYNVSIYSFFKEPQNTLDYHVTNASQPMKKTNFILEEWPYITLNKPLIAKGISLYLYKLKNQL